MENISLEEADQIRKYLFGELSSEDEEVIELKILKENDFGIELLIIEDELIEEYLDEDISLEYKKVLEKFIFSSQLRIEKLKLLHSIKIISKEKSIEFENKNFISILKDWFRGSVKDFRNLEIVVVSN